MMAESEGKKKPAPPPVPVKSWRKPQTPATVSSGNQSTDRPASLQMSPENQLAWPKNLSPRQPSQQWNEQSPWQQLPQQSPSREVYQGQGQEWPRLPSQGQPYTSSSRSASSSFTPEQHLASDPRRMPQQYYQQPGSPGFQHSKPPVVHQGTRQGSPGTADWQGQQPLLGNSPTSQQQVVQPNQQQPVTPSAPPLSLTEEQYTPQEGNTTEPDKQRKPPPPPKKPILHHQPDSQNAPQAQSAWQQSQHGQPMTPAASRSSPIEHKKQKLYTSTRPDDATPPPRPARRPGSLQPKTGEITSPQSSQQYENAQQSPGNPAPTVHQDSASVSNQYQHQYPHQLPQHPAKYPAAEQNPPYQYQQGHQPSDKKYSSGEQTSGRQYPQHQQPPSGQYPQNQQPPAGQYPLEKPPYGQQYPGNMQSPGHQYPGNMQSPGQQYPWNTQPPGHQYPGNLQSPGQQYPGNMQPPDQQYPGNMQPPDQQYPGNMQLPGQHYPGNMQPPGQQYPGNLQPPDQQYPGNIQPPRQQHPGNMQPPGEQYPGNKQPPGQQYLGNTQPPGQWYPGNKQSPGQQYPGNTQPPGQEYPGNMQPPGQRYPGNKQSPGQQYPGNTQPPGQEYPGNMQPPGQRYPGNKQSPGQQYPGNTQPPGQQYPTEQPSYGQQYPRNQLPPEYPHPKSNQGQQYPPHGPQNPMRYPNQDQQNPRNQSFHYRQYPNNQGPHVQQYPRHQPPPGQEYPRNQPQLGDEYPGHQLALGQSYPRQPHGQQNPRYQPPPGQQYPVPHSQYDPRNQPSFGQQYPMHQSFGQHNSWSLHGEGRHNNQNVPNNAPQNHQYTPDKPPHGYQNQPYQIPGGHPYHPNQMPNQYHGDQSPYGNQAPPGYHASPGQQFQASHGRPVPSAPLASDLNVSRSFQQPTFSSGETVPGSTSRSSRTEDREGNRKSQRAEPHHRSKKPAQKSNRSKEDNFQGSKNTTKPSAKKKRGTRGAAGGKAGHYRSQSSDDSTDDDSNSDDDEAESQSLSHVYVTGLPETMSEESLQLYFDARIEQEPQDCVLYGQDHTSALVTFSPAIDFRKLSNEVSRRPFENRHLRVDKVSPPTCMVLSSEGRIENMEEVQLYLETKKHGGGELVSDDLEETEDGCFILEFKRAEVVERLWERYRGQLTVGGTRIRLTPYYRCSAGAIWDTSAHVARIPDPVEVTVTPEQIEYLQRYCKERFESTVESDSGEVCFLNTKIVVRCLLRPGSSRFNTLVKGWDTTIQLTVTQFIRDNIHQTEVEAGRTVWAGLMQQIDQGDFEGDYSGVVISPDGGRACVVITGGRHEVELASEAVQQSVNNLEKQASRISRSKQFQPAKLKVLMHNKVIERVREKFGEKLTIQAAVADGTVCIEGAAEELNEAFTMVQEELSQLEEEVFSHQRSTEWVRVVNSTEMQTYIHQELNEENLYGEWTLGNDEVTIVTQPDGDCQAIYHAILKCVVEEQVSCSDLVDRDKFMQEPWVSLHSRLGQGNRLKIILPVDGSQLVASDAVIIVGIPDLVAEALSEVKPFIEANEQTTEHVTISPAEAEFIYEFWADEVRAIENEFSVILTIKSGGYISVQGDRQSVTAAKPEIKQRCQRIKNKVHIINRKDVQRVMRVEKPKLKNIEKNSRCLVKFTGAIDDTSLTSLPQDDDFVHVDRNMSDDQEEMKRSPSMVKMSSGMTIEIVFGEIGKQQGDVLVCSIADSGRLDSGYGGKSLLRHGGNQLQKEVTRRYKNGLKPGELAVIGAGNLRCDRVYLTALPKWEEEASRDGKTLIEFMKNCLKMAGKHSKKSIVFNVMGTGGYLGYPKEKVASVMYSAVMDFEKKNPGISIKQIKFVVHSQDKELVQEFRHVEKCHVVGTSKPKASQSSGCTVGNTRIEVVTDNLETQTVDAILCTVSADLNLSHGGMSKALLTAGGKSLQDDLTKRYGGRELRPGEVVEIGRGSLKCKAVFLTVLPPNSGEFKKTLLDVMTSTLLLVKKKGYKSLAVPPLGTGYLKYPKEAAANTMYKSVVDWASSNPKSSLTTVRFVLYHKDREVQQAFWLAQSEGQARMDRAARKLVSASSGLGPRCVMTDRGCFVEPVELKVCGGDILQENTEAIVNGLGSNFEMQGAVAKALLTKCPKLKQDLTAEQSNLQKDGVAVTRCSGIPASHVIHVQFQKTIGSWGKVLLVCLNKAESHKIKSLALPMLGAGAGSQSFKPEEMTEALFDALLKFRGAHPSPKLKEIRLVIFQSNQSIMSKVMTELQKRTSSANQSSPDKPEANIVSRAIGGVRNLFGSRRLEPENRREEDEDHSKLEIEIFSDSDTNIAQCIQAIEATLNEAYIETKMDEYSEDLKALSAKEIELLLDVRSLVDIKFIEGAAVIKISGPAQNVAMAKDEIHRRMRDRHRRLRHTEEAEALYKQVQWCYEETTATSTQEIPYDEMNNFYIEEAYKKKKTIHKLHDSTGKVYVVDFRTWEEYSEDRSYDDSVRVVRKDILKGGGTYAVPQHWAPMADKENIKLVDLPSSTREHQDVAKRFMQQVKNGPYKAKVSPNIKVIKVERVQNRSLHQQYTVRKNFVTQQKREFIQQIERTLWHGTKQGVINSIITNGFNRSYSGGNTSYAGSPHYGEGSYFAACASYSAQGYLAGSQTTRYMFQVGVVAGEVCQGQKGMRYLPASKVCPGTSNLLCDCAVDNPSNPMEFITFHDAQAYPEYMVTYSG